MPLFLSQEEKRELESVKECYMLGILVDENEDTYPGQFSIMNNSDNIRFIVKAISDNPEPIKIIDERLPRDSKYYIGIDKHLLNSPVGLPLNYRHLINYEEKKSILIDKIYGKIILFKPVVVMKQQETLSGFDNGYMIFKNIEVIGIEETDMKIIDSKNFSPIPVVKYNFKDFDVILSESQYVEFEDYSDKYFKPAYVICNDYFYFGFKNWERHSTNPKLWRCIGGKGSFRRIQLDQSDLNNRKQFIRATENLFFVDEDFALEVTDNFESEYLTSDDMITIEDEHFKNTDTFFAETNNEDFNNSESDFLESLTQYTLNKGLTYTEKDLINFHICMKTNLLNILSGMTGTGKSQLARAYSAMLNLSIENENLLFMPISPNYTEPTDVLGYLNNINGIYVSAESGLLDFLIKASQNQEKMFVVIFDEMNLAQVEHWFSTFLALLEVDENERFLQLYSKNARCINDNQYPHKIKIGQNLRFIGTMNIDETTKEISDRLLDRANFITLNKVKFKDFIDRVQSVDKSKINYKKNICTRLDEYYEWVNQEVNTLVLDDEELRLFDNIHELIIKYDSQKGVSFRVLKKINLYLKNIPMHNGNLMIDRCEAIDLQLKQRVITKLKGTNKQFGSLIGNYDYKNNIIVNSELLDLLNDENFIKISDFRETKNEILRKSKDLTNYGFTN